MLVEVCANSLQSALNAEKAGASRIELCMELGVGGVTPSYGLLKSIKENISIPVHVLIRPRSGNFCYSNTEFEIMLQNIDLCVKLGFQGIVAGVLTKNFEVDIERTAALIKAAKGLKFTFHRAFDWVENPKKALKKLEALKVDYILTSGQQNRAIDGLPLLEELKNEAKHCVIMPGGGIHINNIKKMVDKGFSSIHLSGIIKKENESYLSKITMYSKSFLKDTVTVETNMNIIKAIVSFVK